MINTRKKLGTLCRQDNRFTAAGRLLVLSLALLFPSTAPAQVSPQLFSSAAAGDVTSRVALQGDQAVQQLRQEGAYESLQEAVAATRYELHWENRPEPGGLPPAYHASNPGHRLNAYFEWDRLHLTPEMTREAGQADWRASMRLIGYGYGANILRAGSAELQAQGNRIEYRRRGLGLTEWYINKVGGLEQGFTIDAPPGKRLAGEPLRVALEVTGDLNAEPAEGGQSVTLKRADGKPVLSYSGLYAYDARQQPLPGQMRVSEGRVILEVDDEKAIYPVTIDPTFSQQTRLTAPDGAYGDWFGGSVALYWNTAVVGARYHDHDSNPTAWNQGAAYVFLRDNGAWSQQAKLTAHDARHADNFGYSVSISGDTVVVGRQDMTGAGMRRVPYMYSAVATAPGLNRHSCSPARRVKGILSGSRWVSAETPSLWEPHMTMSVATSMKGRPGFSRVPAQVGFTRLN